MKNRKPTWHAYHIEEKKSNAKDNSDSEADEPKFKPYASKTKKKPLAIMNGSDSGDTSMPSLQTVSSTSDDGDDYSSGEESEDEDEDEHSDADSEAFDEEEEDRMRDFLREAMDIISADPDYRDPRNEANEFKEMLDEKKGNPFLKLLGNLRGVNTFSGQRRYQYLIFFLLRPYVFWQCYFEDCG